MKKKNIKKFIILFLCCDLIFTTSCDVLQKDSLYKYQWYLHGKTNFNVDKKLVEVSHETIEFTDKIKDKLFIAGDGLKENKNVYIDYENISKELKNAKDKKKIIIALIDGGVDLSNDELNESIWINEDEIPDNNIDDDNNGFVDDVNGYNFLDSNSDVSYENEKDNHATSLLGLMVAKSGDKGIKGIAYDKDYISVMPIKIKDTNRSIDSKNLIDALKYAEDNGATICNLSIGTYHYDENLDKFIKNSHMQFVVAAGNGTLEKGLNLDEKELYPAILNYNNVITVGNLSMDGEIYKTSNTGSSVDIYAPGTFILSNMVNGKYGFSTGTSYSTALVSGILAIYLCKNGEIEKKLDWIRENICSKN